MRIIRFTASLRRYYIWVSVLSILVAAMSQVIPLITRTAIDTITSGLHTHHTNLTIVIVCVVAIFLSDFGQDLFSNINGYYGDILSVKLQRLLSNRYYEQIMRLPQTYFDQQLTGTIINRLSRGVDQLTDYIQFFTNNFLQLIFSTLFTLAIVAYYSWPVALILAVLFPTYFYMTSFSSKKWQGYQKDINTTTDQASGRFAESVSQIKVVKSFVQEVLELRLFDQLFGRIIGLTRPQSRYWHTQDFWRRFVLAIMFLAMYSIIFIQTARGVYSLGTMVLLIQFAQYVRLPLFSLSFYVDRTQRAIANSKDYFLVMDEKPAVADSPSAKRLRVSTGTIEFNDVSFNYADGPAVLRSINFEIAADSKVALVGESGQGKTTITSLLLRLYDIPSGQILIDGQNIAEVTQKSLRQNIGVVFQEPALFSGSIHENITYGQPKASREAVIAAAQAANADAFIQAFPQGYDTEIGERGLKLSGGQKQRIAIARALLKNAPILLLDEATSSLDTKSERQVQLALNHLMQGRTTLIIAHRLSTISQVDKIITIRGGQVDEIGSPAALAKSGGIYDRLLQLQNSHTPADEKKLQAYGFSEAAV
jgi:ATP-binding cassette subfamily B protein